METVTSTIFQVTPDPSIQKVIIVNPTMVWLQIVIGYLTHSFKRFYVLSKCKHLFYSNPDIFKEAK